MSKPKRKTHWYLIIASILILVAVAVFGKQYILVTLMGILAVYFLSDVRKQYLTQNSRLKSAEIVIYVIVPSMVFFFAILLMVYLIAFPSVSFFEVALTSIVIMEFVCSEVILIGASSTLGSLLFRSRKQVLPEVLSYYDRYQRLKRKDARLCGGNTTPPNVSPRLVPSRFKSSVWLVLAFLDVAEIPITVLSFTTILPRDLILAIIFFVAILGAASTPIALYPQFLMKNIEVYSIQGSKKENLLDSWSEFSNKLGLSLGILGLIGVLPSLCQFFGGSGYYLFSVILTLVISGAICYFSIILYTVLEESIGQDNMVALQLKVPPCSPKSEDIGKTIKE